MRKKEICSNCVSFEPSDISWIPCGMCEYQGVVDDVHILIEERLEDGSVKISAKERTCDDLLFSPNYGCTHFESKE